MPARKDRLVLRRVGHYRGEGPPG